MCNWDFPIMPTMAKNRQNMKRLEQLLAIIFLMILSSCSTTRSTTILYSDNYDQTTDRTSVMIFPYGEVRIPGKWTKTGEYAISGQYFFVGRDSVKVAIALQPWDKYEFSHNNPEITPDNFVRQFYEWDANYLKQQTKGQLQILIDNPEQNYLIWNLRNARGLNDVYLFGLKGKTAYNLRLTTEKWNEEAKIKFLEQLFTN